MELPLSFHTVPNIGTVWNDKGSYPCAVVLQNPRTYAYYCYLIDQYLVVSSSNSTQLIGVNFTGDVSSDFVTGLELTLNGDTWFVATETTKISAFSGSAVRWTSHDILNPDGTLFFAASSPVDPNAPTGTIQIESSQILDDSASFVIYISDVDFTSAEYTLKYIVYSGGEEIKSNVSEVITDGTEGFHLTSPNLTPETEYEIQFILQKDGVDTSVTASTSFTTLAGSGAEEGETPDYTGHLEDIQQSVDNVGTKLDGVQDTLTETKEEITSLPQKIATR